jgi:hypothetical protein
MVHPKAAQSSCATLVFPDPETPITTIALLSVFITTPYTQIDVLSVASQQRPGDCLDPATYCRKFLNTPGDRGTISHTICGNRCAPTRPLAVINEARVPVHDARRTLSCREFRQSIDTGPWY